MTVMVAATLQRRPIGQSISHVAAAAEPASSPSCVRACETKMQTHTQSKDRGSLPRVYGSSTATDMLGTRVHQLRISKFIGMPSRRRRNCQSQKVALGAECVPGDAHTDRLTSRGRNDIASWRKLARRPPLLFECWYRSSSSRSSRSSGNDSSKDGQQRCDRDALHTNSPPTTDH